MLGPEDAHHVRTYKYNGGDSSLLYAHVLSPLAQFCVDTFVPLWMAPNVITVSGLIISLLGTSIVLFFNPTLGPDGPKWIHFVAGMSIFLYQTLDNMDGKQARKTGSSSALGMFVDHGCDAINAGVSTLLMASVFGLGWTPRLIFTYSSSFIPFYFQTWEEHYSGAMLLPIFNGPSDGLFMCVVACFYASWKGSYAFHEPLFYLPTDFLPDDSSLLGLLGSPTIQNPGFSVFSLLFFFIYTTVIATVLLHLFRVTMALSIKKNDNQQLMNSKFLPEHETLEDAVFSLVPVLLFFPSVVIYILRSRVGFAHYPVIVAILFCTSFAEMAMHMMVGSICHRRLEPLARLPAFSVVLLALYTATFGQRPGGEHLEFVLLVLTTLYSVGCFAGYASTVSTCG